MKILLDENLPHKLRALLINHDCFTVTYMGWDGLENGELLRAAATEGFDALVSSDKGLEYEQNQTMLPLAVVVLALVNNKLRTIESMVPQLLEVLENLPPRTFIKITPVSGGDEK